ncbi:MAG: translocation/assembly module TamB, partial [Spirochaetales bacterium]|nr:translocation/assembly module TamB [Spirochaetales bacterium]
TIKASGVEAGVSLLANKIEPFNTTVLFSDKTLSIGSEILNINNGVAKVEADFIIEKWIPGTYSVDVKVPADKGIHVIYDVPGIGLSLDGLINGDLQLYGNKSMFSINSDLKVDECIIGIGQKEETEQRDRRPLSIDMDFTTGKDVQFIWPSKTLPILQATAQSDQVINFKLDSLSNTFSVNGDIKIKHGGINYFQKSFYLTKGSILFNESELKFDPILDFTAKIKEVDSRGEVVNISLILDKTPLSKFEPRFESDPPLPDVEIFSILGTGIFTEIGSEKIDLTSALLLTSDLVTQFGIIQTFEKKVKSIFNLDLFSIRTQMIQNILIDRYVEDSSRFTDGRLDSFGSYLNNTTLYLGKYFGNDIFLQALLQISNEQLSAAGQLSATDELSLESTISLEWQTPFFLLGFSIKPDFNDPLSSIQNTSLKLSWDYSY